jgi:hypothetical protein
MFTLSCRYVHHLNMQSTNGPVTAINSSNDTGRLYQDERKMALEIVRRILNEKGK